jgi:hypothetical protein
MDLGQDVPAIMKSPVCKHDHHTHTSHPNIAACTHVVVQPNAAQAWVDREMGLTGKRAQDAIQHWGDIMTTEMTETTQVRALCLGLSACSPCPLCLPTLPSLSVRLALSACSCTGCEGNVRPLTSPLEQQYLTCGCMQVSSETLADLVRVMGKFTPGPNASVRPPTRLDANP